MFSKIKDFIHLLKHIDVEALNKLGLKYNFEGDGMVITQDIKAGKQLSKGSTVNFKLQKSAD